MTRVGKVPGSILLSEIDKQNNNIQVFIDQSMIEVGKSKKQLNIFNFS